jgi:hypothetical protein
VSKGREETRDAVLHTLHTRVDGGVGGGWFDGGMETPTFPSAPTPPDAPSPAAAGNGFADLIDAVRMFEGLTRWATACGAEAIETARVWTESTDLSVPTTGTPRS